MEVYRPKDTHYAESKVEPDYIAGNLLKNDTNQVCGTPIMKPYNPQPEPDDYSPQSGTDQSDGNLGAVAVGVVVGLVLVHVSKFAWNHGLKTPVMRGWNGLKQIPKKFDKSIRRDIQASITSKQAVTKKSQSPHEVARSEATLDSPQNDNSMPSIHVEEGPGKERTISLTPDQYRQLLQYNQELQKMGKSISYILDNAKIDPEASIYLPQNDKPEIGHTQMYLDDPRKHIGDSDLQALMSSKNDEKN